MNEFLEVIRRCKHCVREMNVSSREYDENPYCQKCLPERLEKSITAAGPMQWEGDGEYLRLVPKSQ